MSNKLFLTTAVLITIIAGSLLSLDSSIFASSTSTHSSEPTLYTSPLTNEENQTREEKLIQKISWTISRQLTWAGLFLASLVGIVELLPHIKRYKSWKAVLFIILVGAVIFSVNQSTLYIQDIANKEYKLNEYGWSFSKKDWSLLAQSILIEVNGAFQRRMWLIYLSWMFISIFFILLLREQMRARE